MEDIGVHSINQFGWKYTEIVLDYPESSIKGYLILPLVAISGFIDTGENNRVVAARIAV